MGIRVSHDDFKIDVLSNRAVALVSEFALILYRRYGILIDVNSNDVILRVFQHSIACKDRRLISICLHIKTEFSMHFTSNRFVFRALGQDTGKPVLKSAERAI